MKAAVYFIKVFALIIFGAVLRTLFQIAYLGASREHHGFGPDAETAKFMWLALFFAVMMIWSIVVIRKPDIPFRLWQILAIAVFTLPVMIYLLVN